MCALHPNKRFCEHLYCRIGQTSVAMTAFFREFVHAPTLVGSVCPSSRALSSAMAGRIPFEKEGLIIDLGAGSGAMSRQLLQVGITPDRIFALEISTGFAESFGRNCPGVSLCIGDACELGGLLDQYAPGRRVCGIVSSLPFRVLPAVKAERIVEEIRRVLVVHKALLVQYSYAWWMHYPLRKFGFSPCSAKLVINNIPPARVEAYTV